MEITKEGYKTLEKASEFELSDMDDLCNELRSLFKLRRKLAEALLESKDETSMSAAEQYLFVDTKIKNLLSLLK